MCLNFCDLCGLTLINHSWQRLGLALALLNNPDLLILDEPTNGLDPAGIHEMRDLIRRLPDEFGVTVFLSSHLLGEVEQIATHIGIIHEGSLLFQGPLAELQSKQQTQLTVGVKQLDAATEFLVNTGWSVQQCVDNLLNVSTKTSDDAVQINKLLLDRGLDVFHLAVSQRSGIGGTFFALFAASAPRWCWAPAAA